MSAAPNFQKPWFDQLLTVLWLIILPLEFPLASPLRYPVMGLMLVMMMLHWRQMLPLLIRAKWFFILPAYCLLSALWADSAALALRFGVFMMIGMMLAIYTATRLTHRQFIMAILISSALLMLGSLLHMEKQFVGGIDGGYVVVGLFPQKNVLGVRMLILSLAALIVATDKQYGSLPRLLGLFCLAPAAFLLYKSQSATALVLYIGSVSLILFITLIWRPASSVRGMRPLLVAGFIGIFAIAGLLATNVLRLNPFEDGLQVLGKDTSLTGRTDIWRVGNEVIANHPLLGVGAGNFWQPGVNQATKIASQFNIDDNQFYFHNVYYEATVALGFPGLLIFIVTMIGVFGLIIKQWLFNQKTIDPFFIGIAAILLLRSFTESELFSVFLMNPLILWTGAFLALAASNPTSKRLYPSFDVRQ